jgi:hypothetical protein
VIRELARYDVSRYKEIGAWPLAEALLALEARMIERAQRIHWQNTLSWQIGGGDEAPAVPAILQDEEE